MKKTFPLIQKLLPRHLPSTVNPFDNQLFIASSSLGVKRLKGACSHHLPFQNRQQKILGRGNEEVARLDVDSGGIRILTSVSLTVQTCTSAPSLFEGWGSKGPVECSSVVLWQAGALQPFNTPAWPHLDFPEPEATLSVLLPVSLCIIK